MPEEIYSLLTDQLSGLRQASAAAGSQESSKPTAGHRKKQNDIIFATGLNISLIHGVVQQSDSREVIDRERRAFQQESRNNPEE